MLLCLACFSFSFFLFFHNHNAGRLVNLYFVDCIHGKLIII
ncbi:putative signal peptide protein [Puccinia sorghi]|uniref:Putative signal peptide protein n=1 Tax=Puccinia sorghi TaxID=27349 RepID=A0A0L6VJG8_9BASI|nr:putative signal peptide protein [Puccinia sorghi]